MESQKKSKKKIKDLKNMATTQSTFTEKDIKIRKMWFKERWWKKEGGYMVKMNIRRNNTKSKFYLYLKHKFGINKKQLIPKWFYLIRILFYPIETIKWIFEK